MFVKIFDNFDADFDPNGQLGFDRASNCPLGSKSDRNFEYFHFDKGGERVHTVSGFGPCILDWNEGRGVRLSPLWVPRSWTRAPPVPPPSRAGHERGAHIGLLRTAPGSQLAPTAYSGESIYTWADGFK